MFADAKTVPLTQQDCIETTATFMGNLDLVSDLQSNFDIDSLSELVQKDFANIAKAAYSLVLITYRCAPEDENFVRLFSAYLMAAFVLGRRAGSFTFAVSEDD